MTDLANPRLLWLKGALFLLGGCLGGALILLQQPTLRAAGLLGRIR